MKPITFTFALALALSFAASSSSAVGSFVGAPTPTLNFPTDSATNQGVTKDKISVQN